MPRVRLQPGLRVSDRSDTTLQVGLHAGHRVVLPDSPDTRALLSMLAHGIEPTRVGRDQLAPLTRLADAGLLIDPDRDVARSRAREAARVQILADHDQLPGLQRRLTEAGLPHDGGVAAVALVVTVGAEPERERIDRLVQADRPHLFVTAVAGRVRIGPCVVPGLTACLRCLDAHLTDRDPRHALVVEQYAEVDPNDRPAPVDLGLGLAWAVRDLVSLVDGDRPTTWSATVEIGTDGPVVERWRRHPGCGCAWGDVLAG